MWLRHVDAARPCRHEEEKGLSEPYIATGSPWVTKPNYNRNVVQCTTNTQNAINEGATYSSCSFGYKIIIILYTLQIAYICLTLPMTCST